VGYPACTTLVGELGRRSSRTRRKQVSRQYSGFAGSAYRRVHLWVPTIRPDHEPGRGGATCSIFGGAEALTGVRAPLKTDWDGSGFGVPEGQVSSTRARRRAGGPAFEPESPPDRGCLGHRQVRHPIRRPAADGQDLPNRRRVVVGSRTRRMASGLSAWMEKSTMSVSPPPNAQELAHQLPETLKHHPANRKLDSDR
jgi:hypothetical protein